MGYKKRLSEFFKKNYRDLFQRSTSADVKGFRAKLFFKLKAFSRLFLAFVILFHLVFIATTSICIISYNFINPFFTLLAPYRAIFYKWNIKPVIHVRIAILPQVIPKMLVGVEDSKFYDHYGIDFEAIKHAREINKKYSKRLYGGSTITMQLARTLFLVPEKTYVRKYLELIVSLELELFLSKQRILELYLNYAEWGKGIFGIGAATKHWYNKSASALTFDQSARLIAILASPIRYGPGTLHNSSVLQTRYTYLQKYARPRPSSEPLTKPPEAIHPDTMPEHLESEKPSADIEASTETKVELSPAVQDTQNNVSDSSNDAEKEKPK